MTATQKIEQEFKKLTPTEQAELYERLGEVVYGEDVEDAAFVETLKRRVAEIESGAAKGRNAFEALDEMKAKHSA